MRSTLEMLWDEYMFEECTAIDTIEERRLSKVAIDMHERLSAMLNKEQEDAVQEYVDALCDIHTVFTRKAFLKGCEFSSTFIVETLGFRR